MLPFLFAAIVASGSATGGEEEPKGFDPTFGGRLSLLARLEYAYSRVSYTHYGFNFPTEISVADADHAAEYQRGHDDEDQDIEGSLTVRLRDVGVEGTRGGFSLRAFKDLDGSPLGDELRGLESHFGGREDWQIGQAWGGYADPEERFDIRIGRQYAYESESVHFDGAWGRVRRLTFGLGTIELRAFGGRRVTYFSNPVDDEVLGGGVRWDPIDALTLEASEVYLIDSSLRGRATARPADWLELCAETFLIDEDPAYIEFAGTAEPLARLEIDLGWREKLGQRADDFTFDFTQTARGSRRDSLDARRLRIEDLDPYDRLFGEARILLADRALVRLGGRWNRVVDRDDRDFANADFGEVWTGVDWWEFPWRRLAGSLGLRWTQWDHPPIPAGIVAIDDLRGEGERNALEWRARLEQGIGEAATVGADVAWRTYDYRSRYASLDDMERLSAGADARIRFSEHLSWSIEYAYDEELPFVAPDLRWVQTLRTGLELRL
ncbi:MAG: hypothetical protein JXP34_20825 [Planctomycetes bacterium]|nr:hypothetical protein [Planctomycetota bacterium]